MIQNYYSTRLGRYYARDIMAVADITKIICSETYFLYNSLVINH